MTGAEPSLERRPRAPRRQSEDRRQDLLAVTVSCLARLGPRGTTGREICRQAGVSHGLLRHYFANPDNLLLETYEQLCDRFLARIEGELAGDTGDPWAALDRFFGLLFTEEWANADVLGAWIAFWTLVRSREDFARVSDRFNRRLHDALEQVVRRLPASPRGLRLPDAIELQAAVMDGLWLEHCLSPNRMARDRATALCSAAARRLFG